MNVAFQMKHSVDNQKAEQSTKILIEFFLPDLAPQHSRTNDYLALVLL